MPTINFTFKDAIFSSLWLWTELHLLAIAVLLSSVFIFLRKMSSERMPLHKRTVLITNGTETLSQALRDELIEKYDCRVVLVCAENQKPISQPRSSEPVFECDLTNRQQVAELASIVKEKLGLIEVVIHLESSVSVGCTPEQIEHFVSQSSYDILGFINILTKFVPVMLSHGGGRIVSIRNKTKNSKALLDSEREYHDLVKNVSLSTQAIAISGPESIKLSTILCDRLHQPQQKQQRENGRLPTGTKQAFNHNVTDRELAQRILKGIESEQSIVQVSTRRSLLELCSSGIAQLATIGLDQFQRRKAPKISIKLQ
ncbi:uncharacterized protein LOC131425768 [Malaya genurostris]|uniref:uncharacterized protein LOC131425768 n=1 Tax=Malaya genurostris TaxID=325434 RepID=UPI0026F3BADF|nr:uncharacterized protein LOC131425768 [Malaya genurostris]